MSRKRWVGLSISLFLSSALLLDSASAWDRHLQVPIIPPQVPLDGPEATLETHEFVRRPRKYVP